MFYLNEDAIICYSRTYSIVYIINSSKYSKSSYRYSYCIDFYKTTKSGHENYVLINRTKVNSEYAHIVGKTCEHAWPWESNKNEE